MWVVMDEPAQERVAIPGVFCRIQNVLMPKIVEVMRPGHNGFPGIGCDKIQELTIFRLHAIRAPANAPPPTLLEGEFLPDAVKIQRLDFFPDCIHV